VLLHIKSVKGKGYPPAEAASDKYHGVAKFDVSTGKQKVTASKVPSYTTVFANSLIAIAETDRSVCGITAAMPGGTGMDKFGRRFPKRTFDVGIAEQHAVTFAAGMVVEGLKPFCAIYSTFMQRAYDQVIHDVALQKLPVRMIMDRAGLVGNDGATHHGTFDLAYMSCIPDIVIMAPSDESELQNMIETSYQINDLPSAVRYPRGNGYGINKIRELFGTVFPEGATELPARGEVLEIGKGRIVKRGDSSKPIQISILSIGTRLASSVLSARALETTHSNIAITVMDARFMKPLDETLILQLAQMSDIMLTIEEGSRGGFGSAVLSLLSEKGVLDRGDVRVRSMTIPEIWIEQGTQKEQYDAAGLNEPHIIDRVESLLEAYQRDRDLINLPMSSSSSSSSKSSTASSTVFNSTLVSSTVLVD